MLPHRREPINVAAYQSIKHGTRAHFTPATSVACPSSCDRPIKVYRLLPPVLPPDLRDRSTLNG
jgi:hypothetical protein